jgi:hypothetical protein
MIAKCDICFVMDFLGHFLNYKFIMHHPFVTNHYYILCLFAKGQTKNLKVLRKTNKTREWFVKEKKLAKFAMPSASQLVAQQSSQIYNEPLIIAALLRDS